MLKISLILILVLALSACNWSDEDAKFLAATPQREQLKISSPESSQAQALTSATVVEQQNALVRSSLHNDVVNTSKNVNRLVDQLTAGLDFVHSQTPSKRDDNLRAWGPYDDEKNPGLQIQIVMSRESDHYNYLVRWRRGSDSSSSFSTIIAGRFFGGQATHGHGNLIFDFEQCRNVGLAGCLDANSANNKIVGLEYNHENGSSASMLVQTMDNQTVAYQYSLRTDASGQVAFESVNDNRVLQIVAQWLPDKSGRVDAVAYTTNLVWQGTLKECWDKDFEIVYHDQSYACPLVNPQCNLGTPSQCSINP